MMAIRYFGAGLRRRCVPAGLLALILGLAPTAGAGVIGITANTEHRFSDYGLFDGAVDYAAANDDGVGLLIITLTNTLPESTRGFITGFVFNLGSSDPFAKAELMEDSSDFRDAIGQGAQTFGDSYDAGAALKGHFMGGGNPRKGIAPGESKSFTFQVTATDARELTADDFLDGPFDHNFIVRFRAMIGGGVDIVPAMSTSVPGPSALAVIAIFMAIFRRRSP